MRLYKYVGPNDIKARAKGLPTGREIRSASEIFAWIVESQQTADPGGLVAATFVIDPNMRLLIADRRSEHVACADGADVLAAGEAFFAVKKKTEVWIAQITNQSTGYCPEPECWPAVEAALDRIRVDHPPGFTTACVFRKCKSCGARNIVKDGWFRCDECGQELSAVWNFD